MKNKLNKLDRITAESIFDDLVQAQKNGFPVTQQQIADADAAWDDAARAESLASLNHRLYECGAAFETLAEQRVKARQALKKLMEKQEEIRQLMEKISTYLDGVNHRLSVAAVEESEVLALLSEVENNAN